MAYDRSGFMSKDMTEYFTTMAADVGLCEIVEDHSKILAMFDFCGGSGRAASFDEYIDRSEEEACVDIEESYYQSAPLTTVLDYIPVKVDRSNYQFQAVVYYPKPYGPVFEDLARIFEEKGWVLDRSQRGRSILSYNSNDVPMRVVQEAGYTGVFIDSYKVIRT